VSVALIGSTAAAGLVVDPVAATAPGLFMPFLLAQKTAEPVTKIEFVYTTTNTPASGQIDFYIGWIPLTEGSNLVAV
jgi:hypothetical protein